MPNGAFFALAAGLASPVGAGLALGAAELWTLATKRKHTPLVS